ncbi:MAG: glutathione synthase [Rhodocyclaceae bacterium]|nr:glutathione synthase [Rhodocyclaceae bacterium]
MRLAFIVDPLDGLKANKDTSVAMMRTAARRGHECWTLQRESLAWREGLTRGRALRIDPQADDARWYVAAEERTLALRDFDAVLMRQDPPFDFEYIAATWLLERAEAEGARIFNRPRAIRDHSEKVAIAEFPQFTATTLIARDAEEIQAFIGEIRDCVLKPLDGMGGSSIFRVRHDDPNRNVIVETLTACGTRTIMAQRFLPEIAQGDKRILVIAGEPVPYALARIPKPGESRGNLAAGGTGRAQPLSDRDREIAAAIGPLLWSRGLLLVGLDVIGDCLTEINVTSPTCFVEIAQQTGYDVAEHFIIKLEATCADF